MKLNKLIDNKDMKKAIDNPVTDTVNGFYALASVEDEAGDSDGDIISIAGITSDLNPEEGKYLPVLAAHHSVLENGKPPIIGRIEKLIKTTYKDMPALCMYFTFALNEKGEPLTPLVKEYYDLYKHGYQTAMSVGMDPIGKSEDLPHLGGRKYYKTKLYEVSLVSIGANSHAHAITRSKDEKEKNMDNVNNPLIPGEDNHPGVNDVVKESNLSNENNDLKDHISKLLDEHKGLHCKTHDLFTKLD